MSQSQTAFNQVPPANVPSRFSLDNAATIYPAARTRNGNNTYRLAIVFKDEIKPEVLQQAVDDFYNRLPHYFVRLRTGAFWYYFERVKNSKVVEEESSYPCRPFDLFNSSKPCFRVLYYKCRLSFEIFHSIADGGATLIFIRSLAAHYLRLLGHDIEMSDDLIDCNDPITQLEFEDSFRKNAIKVKGVNRSESTSYRYKATQVPNYFKVLHGIVPIEDLKSQSKKYGVSITEYLAGVLIYAFYVDAQKPLQKPIKISVPISLRNVFNSVSLRNFSSYTNIGFLPDSQKEYTLDDIFESIKGQLKSGIGKDLLLKSISKNVGDASNPFVRFMPNIIKTRVLNIGYNYFGENKFTIAMSNLGIVKMPESAMKYIDRFEVLLGECPKKNLSVSLVSDGKLMNISFTSKTKKTEIQRLFFTTLTKIGARVRVECNDKESWIKQ
ncbi:MAG TPA: hypothetical protein VFD52_08450 [Clostridia bacterium]|nr:hypothetical protein [Clostridia bacterium]